MRPNEAGGTARGVLRALRGFTLLELIVVILVLGILATIATVGYSTITDRAQDAAARTELRQIGMATAAISTLDGDGLFDRDDVREALEAAGAVVVEDGPTAARRWDLLRSGQTPTGPGQLAVGFVSSTGTVSDGPGDQAALVAATQTGKLYALKLNARGKGKGKGASQGAGTPAPTPTPAPTTSPDTGSEPLVGPAEPVESGTTPAEVLTGETTQVPAPTPTPTPTVDPLTLTYTSTAFTGAAQTLEPVVSGGSGAKVFTLTGDLPAGVSFDPATGSLTATGLKVGAPTALATSDEHMLALSEGHVLSWGRNYEGQLGQGSAIGGFRSSPYPVITAGTPMDGKTIVDVAVGLKHSVAVASDGTVYTWGYNSQGQLGDGTLVNRFLPVAVDVTGTPMQGKRIVDAAAGTSHTLVLASDGTMFAWGYGEYGRLGDGTTTATTKSKPVQVSAPPAGTAQVAAVAAGTQHSLALTTDGRVLWWGKTLTAGGTIVSASVPTALVTAGSALANKTVTKVVGGEGFSLALADGKVYSWGYDYYGTLGDGPSTPSSQSLPVAVVTTGALAGKTIVDIAAGTNHSVAISSDGAAYAWGQAAALGNPSAIGMVHEPLAVLVTAAVTGRQYTKVAAGGASTIALSSDGRLAHWDGGMATSPAAPGDQALVTDMDGVTLTRISVGDSATGAVSSTGALFTWGSGATLGAPTLNNPTYPSRVLGAGTPFAGKTVTLQEMGPSNGYALLSDGTLLAWGTNGDGQFANGTTVTKNGPQPVPVAGTPLEGKTITALSSGGRFTLALTSEGKVYSWGYNGNGRLGDGTTTNRLSPVEVKTVGTPMAGKMIVAIAAGPEHSIAVASDGTAYTWGAGSYYRLGDGSNVDRLAPVAVLTSGALAGKKVVGADAGAQHTLVVTDDGLVYAWGSGSDGQVGDGSATMASRAVAVAVANTPMAGARIVEVSAGSSHSLARADDGRVFAWGDNAYGSIGDGTTVDRTRPVEVTGAGRVTDISAGSKRSAAVTTTGRVLNWGDATQGRLGDTTNLSAQPLPVRPFDGTVLAAALGSATAVGYPFTVTVTVTDGSGAAASAPFTFTLVN